MMQGKISIITVCYNAIGGIEKTILSVLGQSYSNIEYIVRYIRKPKPIIIGDLDGLTIEGYEFGDPAEESTQHPHLIEGCELDSSVHQAILQRAVELAKIAWTATGQDNLQAELAAGQRSE
jgi:hypothetical protein